MKKLLLISLLYLLIAPVFAGPLLNFDDKGLISSDGKFVPVQVGFGLFEPKHLFYTNKTVIFSFGLLGVQQRSTILSLTAILQQKNNYGIPLSLISITEHNYGVMTGFVNGSYHNDNHGVKIGVFNVSGMFDRGQFAGIDFCDYLHIGIINYHAPLQFGVVNICEESLFQIGLFNAGTNKTEKNFQIGLLNYNPKSYIPWLPFVNWDMGREEK